MGKIRCFEDGIERVGMAQGCWVAQLQSKEAGQARGHHQRSEPASITQRQAQGVVNIVRTMEASREEPRG